MPWREYTCMSEREEFVGLALSGEVNFSALCRRFHVSRKTGYKWLGRARELGPSGLEERSRRPLNSPRRTAQEWEDLVCELRRRYETWGGRKIHHRLRNLGYELVPAPSTVTGILERNGLLSADRRERRDYQRFEAEEPNDLWQMDFKGHFATAAGRCHPLTVLDDHSRFNIVLRACTGETAEIVRLHLTQAFQDYGLPKRMLMDNGAPWGYDLEHQHTELTAWLIRRGITVSHGRPYHPQTQGKDERFHRTLKADVIMRRPGWPDHREVQLAFDPWRQVYNHERPHEAAGNQPPASRYRPSPRPYAAVLLAIEYERGDEVRKVQDKGLISFRGKTYRIGRAFVGEPVALRASDDGVWDVYYCHQKVGRLDLSSPPAPEV